LSVISFKHVISIGRNDEKSANFNVPVPRFIRDKFNQQQQQQQQHIRAAWEWDRSLE
jgi:hypothetical protein